MRSPARTIQYNPDPHTPNGLILPRNIFDTPRIEAEVRAGRLQGILKEMPHPTDAMLIAAVVDNGMPSWSADQMRYHPGLRLTYYKFWLDLKAAAQGIADAKERVDAARAAWQEGRKIETIHDTPNMSVGMWER